MHRRGGADDVKTCCFYLALAARSDVEPDAAARVRVALKALDRLERAVTDEVESRARCRDRDATAAVRVRPWLVA